jgi:hypothetical protein
MDYLGGLILIAAPWLLGFAEVGGAAVWIPVALGVVLIAQGMMTSYEYGVVGLLSVPAHLASDAVIGAILAVSPWLFGFANQVWIPHVVVGILAIAGALMTETVPTRTPEMSNRGRVRV